MNICCRTARYTLCPPCVQVKTTGMRSSCPPSGTAVLAAAASGTGPPMI